ncbi:MAG: transferase [Desulfobacterales bacterium]
MEKLRELLERIILRVNVNLREPPFDVGPWVRGLIPAEKLRQFYAFYGVTRHHPLDFRFRRSSLAGSYFLGRCMVSDSILYKSDIRGDELKRRGETFRHGDFEIPLEEDERIRIRDSFLIKALVHNHSHDPEQPEELLIQNTVAVHFANIHGSIIAGCFLGPFATVDLTTMRHCVVGSFSYLQAGEISHREILPGTLWIRSQERFDFYYRHPERELAAYVDFAPGVPPRGRLIDFIDRYEGAFQPVFDVVNLDPPFSMPEGASLSRYAVIRAKTRIGRNVLVAQRAYIEDSFLGDGANAQENCFILGSRLAGYDVTAHGAKLVHADLGERVFVGFNAFLRASGGARLAIGRGSIVMPHTIIDVAEPLAVPEEHLVWGMIRRPQDLSEHSLPLAELARCQGKLERGGMLFRGSGSAFVECFRHRIEHILEANGAYFDGSSRLGHAQQTQKISYHLIQPYPEGEAAGLFPTIAIRP